MKRPVVVALIVSGLALLTLGAITWVSGQVDAVTAPVDVAVTGARVSPAVLTIGLVVLASGMALTLAARRAARAILALNVVAAIGGLVAVVLVLRDPAGALLGALSDAVGAVELVGSVTVHWAAYAAPAVLLVALGFGVVGLVRVGSWQQGRSRFDVAVPATDARTRALDDWDALSEGRDPSA